MLQVLIDLHHKINRRFSFGKGGNTPEKCTIPTEICVDFRRQRDLRFFGRIIQGGKRFWQLPFNFPKFSFKSVVNLTVSQQLSIARLAKNLFWWQ